MKSKASPQKQTDPENGHQNYSLCLSGLTWSLAPAYPPSIFPFLCLIAFSTLACIRLNIMTGPDLNLHLFSVKEL